VSSHFISSHAPVFLFISPPRCSSRSRNRRTIVPTSGLARATPKGRHCRGPPRSSVRLPLGRSQFARQNIHGRQSPRSLVPVDADSGHGPGLSFGHSRTRACRIVRLAKNCGTCILYILCIYIILYVRLGCRFVGLMHCFVACAT
jgi:hypothetical protein